MKRLLLLLLCLGLVPLACEKQNPDDDYKVFKSCSVYAVVLDSTNAFKDTITPTDSVVLQFHPEYEYVAEYFRFSLSSSVYADEPPEKGHMGLKHKVDSIRVTASREFNGIPPGKDVSGLFHAYEQVKTGGEWVWTKTEFNFLTEFLNRTDGFTYVSFKKLPEEGGTYIFTFRIYSANGEVTEAKTEELVFE